MAKFTVTFKDPDYDTAGGVSGHKASVDLKAKFIRWDEYVSIEFDTDKGTVTVLPVV